MKKNLLVTALALTLCIGVGTSVYAADNTNGDINNGNKTEVTAPKQHSGKKDFRGGKHIKMEEVLNEKFGITKEELDAAKKDGKTLNALLTEKGIKIEDFRAALIEKHNTAIDEAVTNGKITVEKAQEIKEKVKAKIESNNFDKARSEKGHRNKGDKGKDFKKEKGAETGTTSPQS